MRILQTPVRFFPYIGGVENYVLELSKKLVERGHEVTVICANEPISKKDKIDGINVKRLNYIGKIANTNISLSLPFKIFIEDFDVIHTHIPTPWSADCSAIISLIKRKPLIVTYHNDITNHPTLGWLGKIYSNTLLKLVLKRAGKIIITQPNYLKYSKILQKYKEKVIDVPIGIDTKKFRPVKCKKEKNIVFFMGILDEFHRYKGVDYLIRAIDLIKRRIPDIKLIIGGRGELVDEYKELVKKLDLEKNVKFIGYVNNKELLKLYNKSRIFVLPSVSHLEGFGIVLLEAMSCGTPVICTNIVGAARDVKKSMSGIVLRPKDTEGLSRAVIKILKNKSLYGKMRKNAVKLIKKKYDSKRFAGKIAKIYEKVKK